MPTNRLLLWCYGSLQQGCLRSWILQSAVLRGDAVFCGAYRLQTPHPLLLRAPNGVPALCDAPGVGERVHGELYELERTAFAFLHENMTYRRGLYVPKVVRVEPLSLNSASASSSSPTLAPIVDATTFVLAPKKSIAALSAAAADALRTPQRSPYLQSYNFRHCTLDALAGE